MTPFIGNVQKRQIHRKESKQMVARKWRSGDWEVGVSFWSNRKFLELDIGDYCTTLKKNTNLYTKFFRCEICILQILSQKKKKSNTSNLQVL